MKFKLKVRFGEGEVKENSLGKGKDCDKEVGGTGEWMPKAGAAIVASVDHRAGPWRSEASMNPGHNRPFIDWLMS